MDHGGHGFPVRSLRVSLNQRGILYSALGASGDRYLWLGIWPVASGIPDQTQEMMVGFMGFMAEFMGNEWKWWLDVWKQFQEIINIPILTMWIHFLALFWSYRLDVWLPELRAILEPQIGTLKMPAMASPVNASMPRGLDYEEQYEMLVKYKTRLFRTEQVLLPCGTNVGRDVGPGCSPTHLN